MKQPGVLERITPTDEVLMASAEGEHVLNVTMVYEDLTTRQWATETWGRVARLVGKENISVNSWKISDLARPGILTDAVSSAARADVIVLAILASEKLPADLYAWITAWLPRRAHGTGGLVALIGLPGEPDYHAFSALDYLRAVAHKGGLDFHPGERVLPKSPADFFNKEKIAERAGSITPALAGVVGGGDSVNPHWGLNE